MPTERADWIAEFQAELLRLRPYLKPPDGQLSTPYLESLTRTQWTYRGQMTGKEAARAWDAAHPVKK